MVLVALANGYVTSVDFGAMVRMRQQHGLPECVKATGTTKVFNEYLKCLTYSTASQKIACVGDRGFKIIKRNKEELEVLACMSHMQHVLLLMRIHGSGKDFSRDCGLVRIPHSLHLRCWQMYPLTMS